MARLNNSSSLTSDYTRAAHVLGYQVKQQTLSKNKKIWLSIPTEVKEHALQIGPAAGLWTDHRLARGPAVAQ